MERRKRCRTVPAVLFLLLSALLTGCHAKEELPVYQMEEEKDGVEYLFLDGVTYRRDWNRNELANYYNGGDVWTLADGLGEAIGVCGYGAESGGGLLIYEAKGDEEHAVLYTSPRKFHFGGRYVRLWLREDVSLGLPKTDMVSHVTVSRDEEDVNPPVIDDPALIQSLLDAYESDSSQAVELPAGQDTWEGCTLILHHKDYPFLQYEISASYLPDQNLAYCQNDALEWFALPEEWAEVLTQQQVAWQPDRIVV